MILSSEINILGLTYGWRSMRGGVVIPGALVGVPIQEAEAQLAALVIGTGVEVLLQG